MSFIGDSVRGYTLPVSYTPQVTSGTSTGTFSGCFWEKRGHFLVARGLYNAGSGADGAAARLQFTLVPTGYTVDTTIISVDLGLTCGVGRYFKNGTGEYVVSAILRSTGDVYLMPASNVGSAFLGSGLGNGDSFSWHVEIPILGFT